MFTSNRRPANSSSISWIPPGRKAPPLRLGGIFILTLILAACVTPTEDLSERQQIKSSEIKAAINSAFVCCEIYMLDYRYRAYTQDELITCLDTASWIADLPYIPDDHDCEEFIFDAVAWVRGSLYGIPFGIGFRETQTTHAENLFVDESLNVWIVDIKRHGSELLPASHAFYFLVMI